MGTGELDAGGNPSIPSRRSRKFHATNIGIRSGLVGHLVRMQTLPLPLPIIIVHFFRVMTWPKSTRASAYYFGGGGRGEYN